MSNGPDRSLSLSLSHTQTNTDNGVNDRRYMEEFQFPQSHVYHIYRQLLQFLQHSPVNPLSTLLGMRTANVERASVSAKCI
jgi:hypothetical protein